MFNFAQSPEPSPSALSGPDTGEADADPSEGREAGEKLAAKWAGDGSLDEETQTCAYRASHSPAPPNVLPHGADPAEPLSRKLGVC